jgi:DNA polymerase elongation subunit (family B)
MSESNLLSIEQKKMRSALYSEEMPEPGRLIFDLETTANPAALVFAPTPKAAGNLKDPEKIAADIAAKQADLIEKAALDPDYGTIRALGMASLYRGVISSPVAMVVNEYGYSEKDLIETFWMEYEHHYGKCIGYNIIGFDLPFLLRRSFALGIEVRFPPNMAKYHDQPVTDIMGILYNWGPAKSMKDAAKMYGIDIPKEGVTGADVANLSDEEVAEYVISDVLVTYGFFKKMNGVYFHLD